MHDPMTAVALASARYDDLRRDIDQHQRRRHHRSAVQRQRPARTTTITHRLVRSIPHGLVKALAFSRS